MSDCSTVDEAYEDGIDSLIKDIHALQDKNNVIEQRYQQLEQVARDIFNKVLDYNGLGFFCGVDISEFREQLEELGVSLDD